MTRCFLHVSHSAGQVERWLPVRTQDLAADEPVCFNDHYPGSPESVMLALGDEREQRLQPCRQQRGIQLVPCGQTALGRVQGYFLVGAGCRRGDWGKRLKSFGGLALVQGSTNL